MRRTTKAIIKIYRQIWSIKVVSIGARKPQNNNSEIYYLGGKDVKGEMIRLFIGIAILLLATPVFAQVNVEATGYDWVEYSQPQKVELVDMLYAILKVDKNLNPVDGGVLALEGFYKIVYKQIEANPQYKDVDVVFSAMVMRTLADIITIGAQLPTPSDEELAQYGYKRSKNAT